MLTQSTNSIATSLPPQPRILVVRLDGIGDCVLTTGVFTALRERFPLAHMTGVFRDVAAPLFRSGGVFDAILVADGRGELVEGALSPPYDLAIGPRWDLDYWNARQLILASGAPVRVGFDRGAYGLDDLSSGVPGVPWTHTTSSEAGRHEALKGLDLLDFMGVPRLAAAPRLPLSEVARRAGRRFAASCGSGAYAVLGVSAAAAHRVWPTERFPAVIDALHRSAGLRCIVVGGEEAAPAGRWLEAARPGLVSSAAGELDLPASAALIGDAALYVGMDTGTMHLAAAAGVPVVEISCHSMMGRRDHDNSPSRFGPFGTAARIVRPQEPQAPCKEGCGWSDTHCIGLVNEDEVIDATEALLAEVGEARATGPPTG